MGQMIQLSDASIDTYLYGDNSQVVSSYLTEQMSRIPTSYNEFGERMWQSMQNAYSYVNDQNLRMGVMTELTRNNVNYIHNHFSSLGSFEDLREANVTMQRWIMSHPYLKQQYLNQNLEGYSGTYTNFNNEGYGVDDYNYRRVYDGVLRDTDKDEWEYTYYLEDLEEGDSVLTWFEKTTIMNTHETIDFLLSHSAKDFTSTDEVPTEIGSHDPRKYK